MRSRLILLVLASVLLASCGTGVFVHRFEIAVSDPSGRLGPPPYEMSLFDFRMGQSEEWARKTMGVSAPGAPFVGEYKSVETKMIFDSSPAKQVSVALWFPAYEKAGYFGFVLEPVDGAEQQTTLTFVPWNAPYPEGAKVVPIPARVRSEARDGAWVLRIVLEVGI
jgi:hypothetical protein